MNIPRVAPFLLALAVGACATSPVTENSAEKVPPSRIYEPSFAGPATSSTDGSMLFLRDSGMSGAGCAHDVFVDQVKVFSIKHNEQFEIHLPAGVHFVRLAMGTRICSAMTASLETTVVAHARQVFRIMVSIDSTVRLTRIE
jgi:hypothetical protein